MTVSGFLATLSLLQALQVMCQTATVSDASWTPTMLKRLGTNLLGSDGGSNDGYFRNSGVVIDGEFYYAINGVHTISGSLTSSYPKSLVKAKLADDTVVTRWSFDGSTTGRDVDMEGLTFGPEGASTIYVGDEYNYIYRIDVTNTTGHWDCNNIVGSVREDQGIESISYNSKTGTFYIGIQETGTVHEVTLGSSTASSAGIVSEVGSFTIEQSPSGMFYHAAADVLWFDCGTQTLRDQYLYAYTTEGSKLCQVTIPSSVGLARTDGFFISADGTKAYIEDSQGDQHDSALGYVLYGVEWTDPCGLGRGASTSDNAIITTTTTVSVSSTQEAEAPSRAMPVASLNGLGVMALLLSLARM